MHSISPYSVRCFNSALEGEVKDRYSILDKIGSHDLFNLLEIFIKNKTDKFILLEKNKQIYRFSNVKFDKEKREIHGWFNVGSYGIKSDIIDINTGETDFTKSKNNAEIIKHYFQFFLPKGLNEGVCILHSFRNVGIKTLFNEVFNPFFKTHTNLSLQMNPLSYDKALRVWQEANAKEIKVMSFVGIKDIADRIKGLGHEEQELTFKPPRKSSFGKFGDFFNQKSEAAKAVEVLSEFGKEIKTVVELNGRKRTFRVGYNMSNSVCQIEVDTEVDLIDGVPKLDSMHSWCSGIINEFCSRIYPGKKVGL